MKQNPLDNTFYNALQEAQTQIGRNIINSKEDDENSPIPRINNSPHTAGITDQVIADRNQEPINHTKPESPKETITMEQNSLDNTRDNVCALQNVQSKTEEYTINNQEGYKLELRNSHLQIEGDIINQEQPEKTDPVNAYQNPEPMSQSILSLLEKKILEQKRQLSERLEKLFSREREKEIVKKNNNKNLERSFVDVRKDAAISLQIRKFMELERSFVDEYKDAAMSFVDEYINAAISLLEINIRKLKRYNSSVFKQIISKCLITDEPWNMNCDLKTIRNMFPKLEAILGKLFSMTYELKTQLKAFVKNAVRTSEPVTIEMLRSAASIAGLQIAEMFLENNNSQSITIENLTNAILFPDDCRYPILIPIILGSFLSVKDSVKS